MGDLRVFLSSGNCVKDEKQNGEWSKNFANSGGQARERIRRGLYYFHNKRKGDIIMTMIAERDGVERQLIVEYDGETTENQLRGARRAIRTYAKKENWNMVRKDQRLGSAYWQLGTEGTITSDLLPQNINENKPTYRIGVPDDKTAYALYNYLIDEASSVLISREFFVEAYPQADIVIQPNQTDEIKELTTNLSNAEDTINISSSTENGGNDEGTILEKIYNYFNI